MPQVVHGVQHKSTHFMYLSPFSVTDNLCISASMNYWIPEFKFVQVVVKKKLPWCILLGFLIKENKLAVMYQALVSDIQSTKHLH